GASQFTQILARPLPHRGVGRGEVKALSLRQQPVEADNGDACHLGLPAKFGPAGSCHFGDSRSERERRDFQAAVAEFCHAGADARVLPALESLVANGVLHGRVSSCWRSSESLTVSLTFSFPFAAL